MHLTLVRDMESLGPAGPGLAVTFIISHKARGAWRGGHVGAVCLFLSDFECALQVSKAADVANQIAAEAIAAIRTVAAFSMEAELALQFRLELDKPWKKFVETALVTGLAYGSSFCVIFLVCLCCAPPPVQCVSWQK